MRLQRAIRTAVKDFVDAERMLLADRQLANNENTRIALLLAVLASALATTIVFISLVFVRREMMRRTRLEAGLRILAAENENLFNNAPCGYHLLGADGTYARINNTELSWLGLQREDLIGKLTPLDVFKGESRRKFPKVHAEFLRTGRLLNEIFELVSTTGARRMVSVEASAIKSTKGTIIASRTVLHDVTELEAVRRKLHQLTVEQQAMLDSDLIGIVKIRERKIVPANKAMYRMFGYEAGEMIGKSARMGFLDRASFRRFFHITYPGLLADGKCRNQWEMVQKDGQAI